MSYLFILFLFYCNLRWLLNPCLKVKRTLIKTEKIRFIHHLGNCCTSQLKAESHIQKAVSSFVPSLIVRDFKIQLAELPWDPCEYWSVVAVNNLASCLLPCTYTKHTCDSHSLLLTLFLLLFLFFFWCVLKLFWLANVGFISLTPAWYVCRPQNPGVRLVRSVALRDT